MRHHFLLGVCLSICFLLGVCLTIAMRMRIDSDNNAGTGKGDTPKQLGSTSAGKGNATTAKQPDYTKAVKSVLEQDASNYSRSTDEPTYVEFMKKIDLRECPPDFQAVFLRHRHAWEDYLEESAKQDEGTDKAKGSPKPSRKAIKDTWREVELVALKYGANAPSK